MPEPVTVELYGSLAALAGGESRVTVEAADLRDLYTALAARYPAMAEILETNVSVSIDGLIYTESLFEKIGPDNEVVLLPRIAGAGPWAATATGRATGAGRGGAGLPCSRRGYAGAGGSWLSPDGQFSANTSAGAGNVTPV